MRQSPGSRHLLLGVDLCRLNARPADSAEFLFDSAARLAQECSALIAYEVCVVFDKQVEFAVGAIRAAFYLGILKFCFSRTDNRCKEWF